MVDRESVESICSRIREDGEQERASILEKANRTAAEIREKAEAAGREVAEKILGEAEEKGASARRRLLSSVNLEVKRARLRAREEVVTKINADVEERLTAMRDHDGYGGVLARLAAEAVGALDGSDFIIFADRRDVKLVEKRVLPEVERLLGGEGRRIGSLTVKELDRPSLGGVRVGVPGGNVIFDNTFEARLYRLRDEIRSVIFDRVFAQEGSEEQGSA